MNATMTIDVSQRQERVPVTIFSITGTVDANTAEELEKRAVAAYEAGTRNLVLDLSKVNYMSSAGLRALHTIFMMLRAGSSEESSEAVNKGLRDGTFKSRHLKLVNPSPGVAQVLSTVGFDMFLEIHRNVKEAVASF